nr:MAG TPA: minor capsid protein [Caudoviricetes sp.]
MRYPITPEFMYSLPLPLIYLFQRLEEQILEDICSRIAVTGEMTETAIEHIRALQRRGYDYKKINEYIRKTLKLTQSEFDAVWNKAVQRNQQYFDTLIDDNLILGENNFNADLFMQEINAIEMQTLGELTNITRSMGFAYRAPDGTVKVDDIGRMYQRVLDDALMRVESGQSYNAAIRDATKMLTDSGLQYVDYESGWHNRVDVAARRAVMTGVTQLSRQYTEQTATLLDTPYREVTAHRGARDGEGKTPWASHKKWQGRVYSVRTGDIYPSIYEVCGLDEVDGLCGANCRHMYHIWIEGVSERTYTDEELENIDPPPFEFEGKQYTFYEATQKQRQVEASMRKVKRELIAAKGRGDDEEYTTKAVRYRRLNEEYEAFSKAAGLRPQRERGNIAEFGADAARETNRAYRELVKKAEGMYDTGSENGNVDAYLRDLPIRRRIQNEYSHEMNVGQQNKHYPGTNEYNMYVQKQQKLGLYGPSIVTVTQDELKELFNQYSSTGIIMRDEKIGRWKEAELITTNDKIIGQTVDLQTGEKIDTSCFTIHYSRKKGWHIVPAYADNKGRKDSYVQHQ